MFAYSNKSLRLPKIIVGIITLLFLMTSQVACTATQLPPYEATYTTKLRGIKIKAVRKFESIGKDSYKLSWKAKALWMRLNEWSEFEVINEQVRPISYHYTRKGLGSDKPIHVYFDWEKMLANASKGDKKYQFEITPGILDKLSYQVQMQIDLLESPKATTFNYTVANYNGTRNYQFNFKQDAVVSTHLDDSNNTLLFERVRNKRITRLWISPEQNYLPIKIEQVNGDRKHVAVIQSWDSTRLRKETDSLINSSNPPTKNNLTRSVLPIPSDDF